MKKLTRNANLFKTMPIESNGDETHSQLHAQCWKHELDDVNYATQVPYNN